MDFEEFMNAEFGALSAFAAAITRDKFLGEDVLADALVRVMTKWDRVSRAGSPLAYTRKVIVRSYLTHLRKAHVRHEFATAAELEPGFLSDDPVEEIGQRDAFERLVSHLTPAQRVATTMRYSLDQPDSEIAAALGCSEATARSHLSHAREALRAYLTAPETTAEETLR